MNQIPDNSIDRPDPATRAPVTVLIVEDEPMTRNMLSWMLSQQGYNALTAEDGAQALAISRSSLHTAPHRLYLGYVLVFGGSGSSSNLPDGLCIRALVKIFVFVI